LAARCTQFVLLAALDREYLVPLGSLATNLVQWLYRARATLNCSTKEKEHRLRLFL
jgi:hypothetical protein